MSSTTLITGNTFPVKDELKALGGRWDAAAKGWRVPSAQAAKAQAIVNGAGARPRSTFAPSSAKPARGGSRPGWRPCGYPGCNPGYCDECDGEGLRSGGRWSR